MGFRFETILRLNKNKEDLLQKDMGQINTLIQQQKDSKSFIHEVMQNKKHELNQKKRENIDLKTMILYDNFFRGTEIHKKRQDTIISEITIKMEEKREEVIDAMRISRRHHSLNAPFRDGDKNSLIDVIEDDGQIDPDEPLMAESLKDEIRQSLDTLKDREQQVIKMYFGIDRDYALTLNEIGEEFSLTRERVRQIKEKAIRRLRHRSRSKSLRTYLG